MGFNFRKTISLGKGLKLNLGKKSASVTIGKKGVHHTISTTGRQTTTVGIPGTGLSYSTTTGTKKQAAAAKKTAAKPGTAAKAKSEPAPAIRKVGTARRAAAPKPAPVQPAPPAPQEQPAERPANPFSTGRAVKTHD